MAERDSINGQENDVGQERSSDLKQGWIPRKFR
jgi:hypothetical protein